MSWGSRERRSASSRATCPAIYSRAVNAASRWRRARQAVSLVREVEGRAARSVCGLRRGQAEAVCARLRRPAALLGRADAGAGSGGRRRACFDHVLVDEYQDTNALQASILRGLKPDGAGLTVVGDDAQAIYGFRAATVRNILDFPSQFQPQPRSCGWSRTTARPSQSSPPAMPSSGWPASSSTRTCARTAAWASRRWSRCRMTSARSTGGRDRAGKPRGRHGAQGAGGAVPHLAPQRHARDRAQPPQHPFVKFGGLKFIEAAHVKDMLACCAGRRTRPTA